MVGDVGRRPATLVLWALTLLLGGCAEMGGLPDWVPFQPEEKDALAGVPSPYDRLESLRTLAQKASSATDEQKRQTAAELAKQYSGEKDALIRAELVRTLGEYPGPEADWVLKAALEDPDPDVRIVACETWGNRGGVEAAKLLAGILGGDVDQDVRLAAARALGTLKDPAAVAALGDALEDKNPAMQYRAVLSLRSITGKDLGSDVNRWREYVQNGQAKPAETTSIAARIRDTLF